MKPEASLNVLLEMRPALDGYAGIPQETRLLFRGLCLLEGVTLEGLLQTSLRFLSAGMAAPRRSEPDAGSAMAQTSSPVENARLHRYARVVISVASKPSARLIEQMPLYFKRRRAAWLLTLSTLLPGRRVVKTSIFEARFFESFLWDAMFAKTLHTDDFDLVTAKNYRVCTVPWNILQSAGLSSLKLVAQPVYPVLDTTGVDIFIAQTPYPARVSSSTTLVVRYHDALPLFMPHAFANMGRHQASHYNALLSNVASGAYFACVSEATRQDLLHVFPELRDRAVTIHNMVSHHFYEEASAATRVAGIVRARANLVAPQTRPAFNSLAEQEGFYAAALAAQQGAPFRYILMVSTIEPRKNHALLVLAWELLRAEADSSIKLVIVGSLGWDTGPIMEQMRPWINRGALFVLSAVPAADLRVLYRHAAVTVCPSLAEGFDYSGVECMRSGGITIASDINVHREVYADAAEYFEPRSAQSLVSALKKVLFAPDAHQVRERLRARGREVSTRYLPEHILPQWNAFLQSVVQHKRPHP